eukprot:gnl/TRDRNA2_/TRDRNA2_198819_c0_seq1.p2 gnl/TRDRNA2_/TRDRNA2_198819_c0~~gnl/TRDRNA2_/TRDRNA2_198819_c0_seq1.p2  ORF type:complete len:150 (-),score=23.32 gnl/TRDRNA2_/TRDRNA2_198819_c0_seq1:109-492(-)
MGGTVQCCADESSKDKDVNLPPRLDLGVLNDPVAMPTLPEKDLPKEIVRIQGEWCREFDGRPMGNIRGLRILWEEGYQHDPSPLSVNSAGEVEMILSDIAHTSIYTAGPPPRLKWSDGEVWVRVNAS